MIQTQDKTLGLILILKNSGTTKTVRLNQIRKNYLQILSMVSEFGKEVEVKGLGTLEQGPEVRIEEIQTGLV